MQRNAYGTATQRNSDSRPILHHLLELQIWLPSEAGPAVLGPRLSNGVGLL